MTSFMPRTQGHRLSTDANHAQTIEFKQWVGDFNLVGNVLYILLAMASIVASTSVALTYQAPDVVIVLLAILLATTAIAFRIKIFNRYAFVIHQIRVSTYGDLQWSDGWLGQNDIVCVESRIQHDDTNRSEKRYAVICLTRSGEEHYICSNLTKFQAQAISRYLFRALLTSEPDPASQSSTRLSLQEKPVYSS